MQTVSYCCVDRNLLSIYDGKARLNWIQHISPQLVSYLFGGA